MKGKNKSKQSPVQPVGKTSPVTALEPPKSEPVAETILTPVQKAVTVSEPLNVADAMTEKEAFRRFSALLEALEEKGIKIAGSTIDTLADNLLWNGDHCNATSGKYIEMKPHAKSFARKYMWKPEPLTDVEEYESAQSHRSDESVDRDLLQDLFS